MKQFYTLFLFLFPFLSFADGMHVRGLVRDMDSGKPVANAEVKVAFYTGYEVSAVTDSSGAYYIKTEVEFPAGDYDIQIKCREYYSVYGFIHVKKECYNEHKMKRKPYKDTAQAVFIPEKIRSQWEGYATNNLVFLVDISSSMNAPEKLPLLKESLKYLVDELRPTDKIALLTFSNYVKEVLPSTPVSEKALIRKTIDELSFGSTSQGGAALDIAYKTAIKDLVQQGNNRIILASDGMFTSGEKDYKKMEQVIEAGLGKNIHLSVFCFGKNTDYVRSKLKKLTDTGHGNFATITSLEDAKLQMITEAKAVRN